MFARLRPFIWPIVLVAMAATLYVGARRKRDFVDFLVYRTAAERAVAAQPLYRIEDGHYQFKYWPAFAFAMAPVLLLGDEPSRVAWYALSCALLVIYIRKSVATLPGRRMAIGRLTLITSLLLAKSIVQELVNGQTNLVLGLLLMAAFAAARRQQPLLAGLWVGLGAFVKPYALILAPWLAVTAGAVSIVLIGMVVAIGLFAPALVYGWSGNLEQLSGWYHTVTESTAPNILFPENISIAAMWAKWLGPGAVASTLAIATVATLGALAIWVWHRRRLVASPDYLELALLLLLVPLISPQGWDYVLLLAAPAFVALVDRFTLMTTTWRAVVVMGFALVSATIFDLLGRSLYARLTSWAVVTVGALALVGGLAHLRKRGLL